MAGENPDLIVRVAANIEALKKDLTEGKQAIAATTTAMRELAGSTDAVEVAATRTAPKVHNLRTALSSFDGVLASMGVNIGTEIRGLTDLGDAAGKTFTQLGLIATAGLAAGAALAGWKIGRLVAEFFDLDKAIGNTTAKMLGWGDVAGQQAGAKQDTINKAIRDGADANISYAAAIEFNTATVKRNQDGLKAHTQELKDDAAFLKQLAEEQHRWGLIMEELNTAGANWFKTLQGVDGEVVAAVKFYLEAGVSQHTLAEAYALTAVQVRAVATAMSEEHAMAKILMDFNTTAAVNQAALDARAMASIEAKTQKLREATAQAIAFNEAFLQNALATAQATDQALFGGPVDTSVLHSGARGPGVNQGGQIPFGGVGTRTDFSNTFALGAAVPRRASGGPVSGGQSYVVGERGPELFTPGSSGGITANGGGTTVNVYITQPLGTPAEIVRVIGPAVIAALKNSGTRLPVGT
jgi:hypothetical protein